MPRKGLAYARKVARPATTYCATNCPRPTGRRRRSSGSPTRPGMSVTALTVWSRTTHPTMPNLVIDPNDMDDLIAYILSLRERK